MVQPEVKALGKKYNTTGPRAKASASMNLKGLPPSAASMLKSGAFSPVLRAAFAAHAHRASAKAETIDAGDGFIGELRAQRCHECATGAKSLLAASPCRTGSPVTTRSAGRAGPTARH